MALSNGFVQNGTTTPLDARRMDSARIIKRTDGTPLAGVLFSPNADGGVITGTSSMNVTIPDGAAFALSRSASDGVVVVTNVGAATVTLDTAPSSNSRIDVVWIKQNDSTQGDATSVAVFGKTTGTAAASPSVPSIPSGAMSLAQITVPAGVTSTNASGVSLGHNFGYTSFLGGVIRYRSNNTMQGQVGNLPNGTFGQVDNAGGSQGMSVVRNGRWVRLDADTIAITAGTSSQTSSTSLSTLGGSSSTYYTSDTNVYPQRSDGVIGPLTVGGWYQVTGNVSWTSNSTGERYIEVTQNDTSTGIIADRTTGSGTSPQSVSGWIQLAAGDYIKLKGWQNGSSTLTATSQLTARLGRAN